MVYSPYAFLRQRRLSPGDTTQPDGQSCKTAHLVASCRHCIFTHPTVPSWGRGGCDNAMAADENNPNDATVEWSSQPNAGIRFEPPPSLYLAATPHSPWCPLVRRQPGSGHRCNSPVALPSGGRLTYQPARALTESARLRIPTVFRTGVDTHNTGQGDDLRLCAQLCGTVWEGP